MRVVFDEVQGTVEPTPASPQPRGEHTPEVGSECKCLEKEKVRRAVCRLAERDARLRAD
jgi:hypothetical protein